MTITLSPEERAALSLVLYNVGGSPNHSARKFTDKIMEKLHPDCDLLYSLDQKYAEMPKNEIHFSHASIDAVNKIVYANGEKAGEIV